MVKCPRYSSAGHGSIMGSVLMERNEAIQNMKAVFSPEKYAKLLSSEIPDKMVVIAREQHALLAA